MSERYEWESATVVDVSCLPPGEDLGNEQTKAWTLVIGDPDATAFVVEGSRDELLAFADRLAVEIGSTFFAEHENALHFQEHDPRCPVCVAEAGGRS
jgi:hypothetical protein